MKIFITGVTGYIGYKMMHAALSKGYTVHALVRGKGNGIRFLHANLHYFYGDITDIQSVKIAMKGCHIVFHVAAITQLWHKNKSLFYEVNVGGTKNVLEAASCLEVQKFIFTSSCAVLGPSSNYPVAEDDLRKIAFENDYEIGKHCAEELVKEYSKKMFAVIVSAPRVYGPGLLTKGNPVNKIISKIINRKYTFIPGAKNVVGNYAFVDDVVEGHFLAMEHGVSGEKYNLGGENIDYSTFFNEVRQGAEKKIKFIPVSRLLLKASFICVQLFNKMLGIDSHIDYKLADRLFQNRAVNCDKAVKQLGYHITPFKEGIEKTIAHLKKEKYA